MSFLFVGVFGARENIGLHVLGKGTKVFKTSPFRLRFTLLDSRRSSKVWRDCGLAL